MHLQRSRTPEAQRAVDGRTSPGTPKPNAAATKRAGDYSVGLRLMGFDPKRVKAEPIPVGGWVLRWKDGGDRYAKFFHNNPSEPDLLLINEAKAEE